MISAIRDGFGFILDSRYISKKDRVFLHALTSEPFITRNFEEKDNPREIIKNLKNIYEAYRGVLTEAEVKQVRDRGFHPDQFSKIMAKIHKREAEIYNIPDIVESHGGIDCPNCGDPNTVLKLAQYRANDEASTQIFICMNCDYRQRTG